MQVNERERYARQFNTKNDRVRSYEELSEMQRRQVSYQFANWRPYQEYVYQLDRNGNVLCRTLRQDGR